jgi:LysR family hydrogen peroxide-inducible transcriptional activator
VSFRLLSYIVAATKTGNFREAARLCNVTQPSLSERIGKFESYLGVQLFRRTGRGVVPTEAGRIVAELAEQALEIERRIKAVGAQY